MKKILSLILSIIVALSCFGVCVFAKDDETTLKEVTKDESSWFETNFINPFKNEFYYLFGLKDKVIATGISVSFTSRSFKAGESINNQMIEVTVLPVANQKKYAAANQNYSFEWYEYVEVKKPVSNSIVKYIGTGNQAPSDSGTYILVVKSEDGGYKQYKEVVVTNTVTVRFVIINGPSKYYLNDVELEKGETLGSHLYALPSTGVYTFRGWNTSSSGYGAYITSSTPITHNMTLYAIWEISKIVVHFDTNCGDLTNYVENCPTDVQMQNGGTLAKALSVNPSLSGYTFKGWNTKADGTGTYITSNTRIEVDSDSSSRPNITLYAIWEKV